MLSIILETCVSPATDKGGREGSRALPKAGLQQRSGGYIALNGRVDTDCMSGGVRARCDCLSNRAHN